MQVMIENPHKLLPGSFARRKGGGYLLVTLMGKASPSKAEDESRGRIEVGG